MPDKRRLSVWGWGYADKLPARHERDTLASQLSALLGVRSLTPREPPDLASVDLPPPRTEVPASVSAFCRTDRYSRASHTRGKSYPDVVRGLQGDYRSAPDICAFPNTESEVARVLEAASQANLAVVPFGGGTSVVGGVECPIGGHNGVLSLDLRHLNQVAEVDDLSQLARIGAGATGPELSAQLSVHGLTLRHYPQSFEFSTLGGWIATRAGGHFATLYTHIDELVAGTRMITPSGTWASRPLPGSGAGPSPDRLVCGSEGILGVITEAWMRVRPIPRHRASATFRFAEWAAAVDATRTLAQSGLYPSNCRLLDRGEAMLHQVSLSGHHLLLLGFESAHHEVGDKMREGQRIAEAHAGHCTDGVKISDRGASPTSDASAQWKKAFFDAPYLASTLATLGVMADTFETACTWSAFDEMHEELVSTLNPELRRAGGAGLLTCRFTHVYPDGPAPYYTFVTPARTGAELEQWAAIKSLASEILLKHGATITHHHAVGRTHRPWYDRQRPDPFARSLRAAKREVDPQGLLNPGVLIDP